MCAVSASKTSDWARGVTNTHLLINDEFSTYQITACILTKLTTLTL